MSGASTSPRAKPDDLWVPLSRPVGRFHGRLGWTSGWNGCRSPSVRSGGVVVAYSDVLSSRLKAGTSVALSRTGMGTRSLAAARDERRGINLPMLLPFPVMVRGQMDF